MSSAVLKQPLHAPSPKLVSSHAQGIHQADNLQRHILILSTPGAASLDLELIRHTFLEANSIPESRPSYSVQITAVEQLSSITTTHHDTIFLVGPCDQPSSLFPFPAQLEQARRLCLLSRRVVAVAGGAIYLAAMHLLNEGIAVSHWSLHQKLHQQLQRRCPAVSVRSDILYSQRGNIYTSAGLLSSADLAIQLIEDDLGTAAASYIARRMLLPFRRSANFGQISPALLAQGGATRPIADLLAWLPTQLSADLSIAKLARRAAMSPRNFARRFREQIHLTPGRYIEDLRFEAAKHELLHQGQTIAEAASRCGFRNDETLRRLFCRRLGVTPSVFRKSTPA